jgi:hypothetical protein
MSQGKVAIVAGDRVLGQRGGSAGERGGPARVWRLAAWSGAGRSRIIMIWR